MGEPELRDGAWWYRQPDGSMLRWDPAANAWVPTAPGAPVPPAPEPWQPLGTRAVAPATAAV